MLPSIGQLLYYTAFHYCNEALEERELYKESMLALTIHDRMVQSLVRFYSGSHHLMTDGKGRFTHGRKKSHD